MASICICSKTSKILRLRSKKAIVIRLAQLLVLVLLLTISAQIKINLISDSLPLTLQTYAVCIITILLPINLALPSLFLYVAFGTLGAPIFAGGAHGVSVLLGDSGGYVVGFLLATTIICSIRKINSTKLNCFYTFAYSLIIHTVIILCGFIWLGILKGYSFSFYNGLLPLLLPATIKSSAVLITYLIYVKLSSN